MTEKDKLLDIAEQSLSVSKLAERLADSESVDIMEEIHLSALFGDLMTAFDEFMILRDGDDETSEASEEHTPSEEEKELTALYQTGKMSEVYMSLCTDK